MPWLQHFAHCSHWRRDLLHTRGSSSLPTRKVPCHSPHAHSHNLMKLTMRAEELGGKGSLAARMGQWLEFPGMGTTVICDRYVGGDYCKSVFVQYNVQPRQSVAGWTLYHSSLDFRLIGPTNKGATLTKARPKEPKMACGTARFIAHDDAGNQ